MSDDSGSSGSSGSNNSGSNARTEVSGVSSLSETPPPSVEQPSGAATEEIPANTDNGLSQVSNLRDNELEAANLAQPPNSKPDRMKNTGIGVLIDTESLMAPKGSKEARNPYYIVFKGRRYYGSSPRAVVRTFRDQYNTNLRSGKIGTANSKPGVVRSFLSKAKNFSRKASTAAWGATKRFGAAAASGAAGLYASGQSRYASWKQGRANSAAARAALRGQCGFLGADTVVIQNPTEEHTSERGKLGTVQNVLLPGNENCTVRVKMARGGDIIEFAPFELRLASARDRVGNISRRFTKGFTKRSNAAKRSASAAYQSAKARTAPVYQRLKNRSSAAYQTLKNRGSAAYQSAKTAARAAGQGMKTARNRVRQRFGDRRTPLLNSGERTARPGSVAAQPPPSEEPMWQ